MLRFFCTLCGQPMVANEARVGTVVTCPSCKGTVTVPAAAGEPVEPLWQTEDSPLPSDPFPKDRPPQPTFRRNDKVRPWWVLLAIVATLIAVLVGINTADLHFHPHIEKPPPVGMSPATYQAARTAGTGFAHFLEIFIPALLVASLVGIICRFVSHTFWRPWFMAFSIVMLGWTFVFAKMLFTANHHTVFAQESSSKPTDEFLKRVEETTQKILADKKVPKDPAITLPPKPEGPITSDLDRWNEVWRKASAEAAAILPDYDKELKAAGFNQMILPDHIAADKDFTESKTMIEASQQAIKRAHQRFKDVLSNVHKQIDDLHLGPEAAAEAQKSLARTLDKMTPPMEEYFEVEEKIVGQYIEVARYLDSIRPYWVVEDHKPIYHRRSDMDHVRSITAQVKDERARQHEILKELATFLATKIEEGKDQNGGK